MAGIINDLLNIVGFGSSTRRKTSKRARLNKLNRKLGKKLVDQKIEKQIKTRKKRLGIQTY